MRKFDLVVDRSTAEGASFWLNKLWPDKETLRACAQSLAQSILKAHQAPPSCWNLTLFRRGVRLNVGPSEAMTLDAEAARLLIDTTTPLESSFKTEFRENGRAFFYKSVPIPSGAVHVPTTRLRSVSNSMWNAHYAYITSAARSRENTTWKKSRSPGVVESLELLTGLGLPQPSYYDAKKPGKPSVSRLPEEADTESFVEGATRKIVVNAYERSQDARKASIAHYGTSCDVCQVTLAELHGESVAGLIHVHHLKPLSEIGEGYKVNAVAHLRPVCPNCHAVIHSRTPGYTIEEVRSMLRV